VRCTVYANIGQAKKVEEELRVLERSPGSTNPFIQIEKTLIETTVSHKWDEKTTLLLTKQLLNAGEIGTEYQRCQLLNALATGLHGSGNKPQALDCAKKALKLATKEQYK